MDIRIMQGEFVDQEPKINYLQNECSCNIPVVDICKTKP